MVDDARLVGACNWLALDRNEKLMATMAVSAITAYKVAKAAYLLAVKNPLAQSDEQRMNEHR
jgi:hypothetical protein